jgi:hypothetical protein
VLLFDGTQFKETIDTLAVMRQANKQKDEKLLKIPEQKQVVHRD